MTFPLAHRGKMVFVLSGDPDVAAERFYADAAAKIERSLAMDASIEVAARNTTLIVSYTLMFKKILVIVSILVAAMFGIYFALWDAATPPGLPLTWNRSGLREYPSVTHLAATMTFMWLWFFGGIYCLLVERAEPFQTHHMNLGSLGMHIRLVNISGRALNLSVE